MVCRKTKWKPQSFSFVFILLFASLRLTEFVIDPHAWLYILPLQVEIVIYNGAVICLVVAFVNLTLVWIDLQQGLGSKAELLLNRKRLIVTVTIIYCITSIIAITLWVIWRIEYGLLFYSISTSLYVLLIAILLIHYGRALLRQLQQAVEACGEDGWTNAETYIRGPAIKVTRMILRSSVIALFIITGLLVGIKTFYITPQSNIITHSLVHTLEISLGYIFVMALTKSSESKKMKTSVEKIVKTGSGGYLQPETPDPENSNIETVLE